ncbi:hypothetical protein Emin_0977 [Elusimicrobium minutum Pei191]|uniref:Uncharacterized protein n=1 Tax=Elusimicrobium minutum (strain Pei191) TaxID=445932 RepID=B2KDD4_ELUMP|nr:recombinase RecT [Elusimicrobium minutum]ACC98530.1 hypothetical protein Emin_0977 [Elusimicrobium minutum Pei191]
MTTENIQRTPALGILLEQAPFYSKAQNLEQKKIEDMMVSFAYIAHKVIKRHQDKGRGEVDVQSIKEAFKCSMDTGIPVDNRRLAYLTIVKNNSTGKYEIQYEPGYMGFVHKLRQIKPGAVVQTILLWEKDVFTYKSTTGVAEYSYVPEKPMRSDFNHIIGGFCYISYFEHGREYSFVTPMTKAELDLARGKAKTQDVWGVWPGEMYKKVIIKRAGKVEFIGEPEMEKLNEIDDRSYTGFERKQPAKVDYSAVKPLPQEITETEALPAPGGDDTVQDVFSMEEPQ